MFGFDKPPLERFVHDARRLPDASTSAAASSARARCVQLVLEKMPVSISLGLWSTLLVYLVSIPLGIAKAVRDGSRFDIATSAVVLVGYAIPGFLFAIMLVVLFAGGSFVQWFPLRGLTTEGSRTWSSWPRASLDYLWHMVLPTDRLVIGGFASLTMLTKNCFLEEIRKQYVVTARAKGASEQRVLYGHVFRNAMLLIIAGFPAAFIGILFFVGAADRDHLLARRARAARLRVGDPARLSGDVRHALHLHPDRAGDADRRRPHLTLVDPRIDFEAAAEGAQSAAADLVRQAVRFRFSPLNRRRLANFRANRRGYWSLWIFLALFVVTPVRRIHRQRPAAGRPLRGPLVLPGAAATTAEDTSARISCRPRPTTPIPDAGRGDQRRMAG